MSRISSLFVICLLLLFISPSLSVTCNLAVTGVDNGDCSNNASGYCQTIDYCLHVYSNATEIVISLQPGVYSQDFCSFQLPQSSKITSFSVQAPPVVPNSVIINCNNVNSAFVFSDMPDLQVEINDIDFVNGSSVNGGCIFANNIKRLLIQNAGFVNCTAIGSGGAIYANNTESTYLLDTVFLDNQAVNGGGAVYVTGTTSNGTSVARCTFGNNKALEGGAIYLNGNYLSLTNSNVSSNSASRSGGGLFLHSGLPSTSGAFNFLGSTINNNTAMNGGGLYADDMDYTWNIYGALFEYNIATNQNGDGNVACANSTSPFCDSCTATDCDSGCPSSSASCSQTNSTAILCYGNKDFTSCSSTESCTCKEKHLSKVALIIIILICVCMFVGTVLIAVDLIKFFINKRKRTTSYTPI